MSQKRKRHLKKSFQRLNHDRKVLDIKRLTFDFIKHKNVLKKKERIYESYRRINEATKRRDRNLRTLIKSNTVTQPNFSNAAKRNIFNAQREIYENRRIIVCTKRRDRRRFLFSMGKCGKGIRGPKIKRFTQDSRVRC